jgi:hypothetical protein
MIPHVIFGAFAAIAASTGALAGFIAARRKTQAVRALAETVEEPPQTQIAQAEAHPFRSPGVVAPEPKPRRRPGRLHRHDYDRLIGRTFAR